MLLSDFTTERYGRLLDAIQENNWAVYTVEEYLKEPCPPDEFIILRHDVDRKVKNALTLARLEAERGIASTYFFRTKTFDPDVVRSMEQLGHEIGYHYEDLAATDGDHAAARRRFLTNLTAFREVADITTVSPHGSPLSAQYNPDLWDGRLDELRALGVLGEGGLSIDAGKDSDIFYLSDVGRSWSAELPTVGEIETTADLTDALHAKPCPGLYLNVHPGRWTDSKPELAGMCAWEVSTGIALAIVSRVQSAFT